jgi:hypothetical protein
MQLYHAAIFAVVIELTGRAAFAGIRRTEPIWRSAMALRLEPVVAFRNAHVTAGCDWLCDACAAIALIL